MKNYKNLSEKEILRDAAMGTHISECFNRLTFVIGVCDKKFVGRDGKTVFEPGKRYKFWVVQNYSDQVIGATVDLTVLPRRVDPENPGKLYWNAVPLGTFKVYSDRPLGKFGFANRRNASFPVDLRQRRVSGSGSRVAFGKKGTRQVSYQRGQRRFLWRL